FFCICSAHAGNRVFNPKEDTDPQSKILALLLHKSLVPVEKDDTLGLELANKLAELEELRALREDLELEREITANLAEGKSITRKRGERKLNSARLDEYVSYKLASGSTVSDTCKRRRTTVKSCCKAQHSLKTQNTRMILVLSTLPHLTCISVCPASCMCDFQGAVKCFGSAITALPKQLPLHTYLLQLNATNMNVIHETSLADQRLLLRFSLTHSHLHTIHPRAFHVAPQFKSVMLSSNDLLTLPARVFSPLTTLEQLHIDENHLETVDADMFEGLIELKDLDLSRNKLNNLAADVFDGLTNLLSLNLGRNSIKKLPPTIFHSLTKLHYLQLYHNELEVLEARIFDRLANLLELKIHHNHITSLPPKVFWSLRNLRTLTLSSNRLQAVPEKSFYNMPKLSQLTIYKNPLLSLPDQLMGHMPDMTDFYLYATKLTTVPGNLFVNMSGLLRLNFHLNDKLTELPSELFCCLPKLQKLSLKSNNLFHLHPQLFSRLSTLGMLVLSDNHLQTLPENIFQGLGDLVALDLRNNSLKTLPGDIFLSNTRMKDLTLSGNPWDCTCSIRGIAKWIRHNEHVILDRDEAQCHSPMYQLLRTIGSLHEEEFSFCDATYSPELKDLHKTPTPFYTILTSGPTTRPIDQPAVTSTTAPHTTSPTAQGATQQVTISTTTPTTKPSTLHNTILSTFVQPPKTPLPKKDFLLITKAPSTDYMSPPFYDMIMVEQGSEFVHHNFQRGWVYVWFLPLDIALARFLMLSHILLVASGLFLIVAAMYCMCRLNKIMNGLKAECAHTSG
ncbi:hypothetical protein L3Q82_025723, partial [Scortum barcoo]